MVNRLMSINVYEPKETMIVVGSCLKNMNPSAYKKLEKISNNIYELCLEETHINMAITKLMGIFARVNLKNVIFATVDKSPHCIQVHYIESEIKKAMKLDNIKFIHYVAEGDNLIEISPKVIKLSKNLSSLKNNLGEML